MQRHDTRLDPTWDLNKRRNDPDLLESLIGTADLSPAARAAIVRRAVGYVQAVRSGVRPGLMEAFLAEYGLSSDEGVALMCLAEALLRIPDARTIDALIDDKIAGSDWSEHLGQSGSLLVNSSTLGLLLAGQVLSARTNSGADAVADTLQGLARRMGTPAIRAAVSTVIKQMGRQFVLGESIQAAIARAAREEAQGFTFSYDMLGEAALTAADADRFRTAYQHAIAAIAVRCTAGAVADNPGISIKLSALHPRYEVAQADRVLAELVPVVVDLARRTAAAGMGLNIDAEEADRLGLSLAVIRAALADPALSGWDGFGVVVQCYGRRAGDVIDGLYAMARALDRRLMVRLVKGAYWDTEIKHAQVEGLDGYPVFTQKPASDVSFIALSRRLLGMTDRLYPQFATHNAHSVAAILEMAAAVGTNHYEFQRLHGMGEALYRHLVASEGVRCRVYAPVGAHRELLAYLVRRLLENGANSSFVNQIVDDRIAPEDIVACPFDRLAGLRRRQSPPIPLAPDLFQPERPNARGWDLSDVTTLADIDARRRRPDWLTVEPLLTPNAVAEEEAPAALSTPIHNPATGAAIGEVRAATAAEIDGALAAARPWAAATSERAAVLNRVADLYEQHFDQAFSLLATEAGKTLPDAVAELREAVDFLRYYAARAEERAGDTAPRGTFVCISPWNFPLAIFTGQIAAALAGGNAVLAKPAEATAALAAWATRLMHEAGVPLSALQLLPGEGSRVGAQLTSDPRINGVAFTGSTATARRIQAAMADACAPGTPLIAETGGLNAMVLDSTALPEQAIKDILTSAFQSAGQRCSALRCLYVQEDMAAGFIEQLIGAMDQLRLGDPWDLSTDVGPIISPEAAAEIEGYCRAAEDSGALLHRYRPPEPLPEKGNFVAPALIAVDGIDALEREVFGPVLHVATYRADQLEAVIEAVNATGYGLTFGIHTRINKRIDAIFARVRAGNVYANRNQIGAIVGSQPFGGEGLSGTGPKAGGPNYLPRFQQQSLAAAGSDWRGLARPAQLSEEIAALAAEPVAPPQRLRLPGPTGETNELSLFPRAPMLCAGPGARAAQAQRASVEALGGRAIITGGRLPAEALAALPPIGGLLWWGDDATGRDYARALAALPGAIIPLITSTPDTAQVMLERHLCVDTTAAGGNASLLLSSSE